ncbi:MAG TPA: hypothetical protein V6D15_08650 [Oculatellaceae cyanobacterium]|jgi:hypothetical protein
MSKKAHLIENIALKGLEIAPSQVWGAIRIVPLIRQNVRYDLRLSSRNYDSDITIVSLEGEMMAPGVKYISYVPHGLILSWSDDGYPAVALGGQLMSEGKRLACGAVSVQVMHRMAKREAEHQLRFLPLHLAMEGFLSLFFSGPQVAWSEYSKQALRQGLSPRYETAIAGREILGLEEALRVFEIHSQQVGVLLFVSEALASAFVVPTPEDYRALHSSLLLDFYGELLYYYGQHGSTTFMQPSIDEEKIDSIASLKHALDIMRSEWGEFHGFMAGDLLGRSVSAKRVYTAGNFTLQRFITDLHLKTENHIGEAIVRDNGELEYLKTYRLSEAQTRRVYLLSQLAAHDWHLEATAKALRNTVEELIMRLEKAGFGYLVNNQLLQKAHKHNKKR